MSSKLKQENIEYYVLRGEPNTAAVQSAVEELAALAGSGRVGMFGKTLDVDLEAVKPYVEQMFDLTPGKVMTAKPFLSLGKKSVNDLAHFPSIRGSVTPWPFADGMTGITVITGGTGSQKSTLMATNFSPEIVIRFDEPYEVFDKGTPDTGILHPVDLDSMLCMIVVLAAHKVPMGVDSLRKLAYELDGPAGAQGVVAKLYTAITDLNNLVSFLGVTVPVTINPMVKGEGAIETVHENMAGSAAGAILIENGVVTRSLIRRGEGRAPVSSRDPAFATGGITFATDASEERDTSRMSLSRREELGNAPNTLELDPEIGVDTLAPAITATNIDMDSDDTDQDDRRGSDITFITD